MDLVARAVGLFAVTNVDDVVLLALLFGQAGGRPCPVVAGQYLGFGGILVVAVIGGFAAEALPQRAVAFLGLVPLALGLRAGWAVWRGRMAGEPAAGPTRSGRAGRHGPR